jgi:hypothetical protein
MAGEKYSHYLRQLIAPLMTVDAGNIAGKLSRSDGCGLKSTFVARERRNFFHANHSRLKDDFWRTNAI